MMESAPLDVGIVGWHSHNEMFDAIGADLRQAGHRIIRYAHREAFTATPDPLAGIDILLCVGVLPLTRATLATASRLRAIVSAVTGVDGVDIAAMREAKFRPMRRRIQFIFQDPYRSLNPRRTVGEAIIEGPMNFGLSRTEALQRARDLMAVVHLPPAAIEAEPAPAE